MFNKKKTYNTVPGGITTIVIYSLFAYYWCLQFYMMFYYQMNSTSSDMTLAKLDDLGEMTVDEMGAKTLYTPRYKGNTLGVYNEKVCGGDCFEFT